jgi:hypothetical protein
MIEIPFSKKKIIRFIINSCAITVIGVALEYIAYSNYSFKLINQNLAFTKFIAVIMIVFGIMGIIINYKKSKLKYSGLIISNEGIIDKSNNLNIGLIEWKDVTEIFTIVKKGYVFIIVQVRDNSKYIYGNLFKKVALFFYVIFYKSPIVITGNTLEIEPGKLYSILLENYKIHKVPNS